MFGVTWAATFGKHHFWLLPNLTEDCGFFDSFKPAYSHVYYPKQEKKAESDANKEENEGENVNEESKPIIVGAAAADSEVHEKGNVVDEESPQESGKAIYVLTLYSLTITVFNVLMTH